MKLDASQRAAIEAATTAGASIITGGAGTGKTTIIRTVCETLEKRGETVALAAFAGKAAARIREACEHPASTIHRLLGYDGITFRMGPLCDTSIVIDEASMIDAALLAELVSRGPRRLVLVGDPAQLPPVGRGQPFHDLINLRPDMVSSLSTCYRATEAVFQAAATIRGGGRPPLRASSPGEHWEMMNTRTPENTQATIMEWVQAEAFDWSKDIILVARNGESDEEACTVKGLNKAIVDMISPRDWSAKIKIVPGDRVINTVNLPKLDMWNGSTGTVHAIDADGGVWVRTDIPVIDWNKTSDERNPKYTSHVLFTKTERRHLELAYALTVHKAQGSQYRNVCFAGFQRDTWGLLDRALLYTAVTRTKSACMVVGELSAIYAAIGKVNAKRTVMQELASVMAA